MVGSNVCVPTVCLFTGSAALSTQSDRRAHNLFIGINDAGFLHCNPGLVNTHMLSGNQVMYALVGLLLELAYLVDEIFQYLSERS